MTKVSVSAWSVDILDSTDPYALGFKSALTGLGHEIVPIEAKESSKFIALEHDRQHFSVADEHLPDVKDKVLVVFEPRAVRPDEYSKKLRSSYGSVFVQSPIHRILGTEQVWQSGHLQDYEFESTSLRHVQKLDEIAMVNENKFSFVKHSHYVLRLETLLASDRSVVPIRLAGRNWDRSFLWGQLAQMKSLAQTLKFGYAPNLLNYRVRTNVTREARNLIFCGRVESQIAFLSQCKYSLVIENESSYVSEKLLQALAARTIPIYVGPKIEDSEIPDFLYISAEPNVRSIYEALSRAVQIPFNQQMKKLETFLIDSTVRQRWSWSAGVERLASLVSTSLR